MYHYRDTKHKNRRIGEATLWKGHIVRKTFINKVGKQLDYGFPYWAASKPYMTQKILMLTLLIKKIPVFHCYLMAVSYFALLHAR